MIFILGGRGFIGSAISRYCEFNKINYKIITRDNYAELKELECDIFINANGNSKKYLATKEPLMEFDASVRSVKASLTDFKYKHYIHLSSCDVYPDCSSPESTDEKSIIDISKQSIYGFHKFLAEQCVRQFAKKWLIIRMGGFVGVGLKKNPIYDILEGGPLWLAPESRLQYMDTDVFSKILFNLINQNILNQILNVCGSGTIQLQEVADHAGIKIEINNNSPLVTYEISIERLKGLVEVPESRKTVLDFVSKAIC